VDKFFMEQQQSPGGERYIFKARNYIAGRSSTNKLKL
jgi:hypothetical protein